MLIFGLQGIVRELSKMKMSHKLTKRTTKTKKIDMSIKILKMHGVIIFKIILFAINWLLRVNLFIQP